MFTDDRAPGWSIDGGDAYFKYSFPEGHNFAEDTQSLVLTAESTLNDILYKTCWGTRGKSGEEPLHYILVMDMELDHITAVLSDLQSANVGSPTEGIHKRVPLYLQLALVYWWGYKKGHASGSTHVDRAYV